MCEKGLYTHHRIMLVVEAKSYNEPRSTTPLALPDCRNVRTMYKFIVNDLQYTKWCGLRLISFQFNDNSSELILFSFPLMNSHAIARSVRWNQFFNSYTCINIDLVKEISTEYSFFEPGVRCIFQQLVDAVREFDVSLQDKHGICLI
jgi:hypothetical protein